MSDAKEGQDYLDVNELSARTGLSPATIWRLKRAGKILYCQPGGPGSAVRFPLNAIEQFQGNVAASDASPRPRRLSGPIPAWQTKTPKIQG